MTAGELRDLVTVLTPTTTEDDQGGQVVTWVDGVREWANVRDLSGREVLLAGAMQAQVSTRITLHHRDGLTVQHRLRRERDGVVYELSAVRDPDGRRTWLECDAQRVGA